MECSTTFWSVSSATSRYAASAGSQRSALKSGASGTGSQGVHGMAAVREMLGEGLEMDGMDLQVLGKDEFGKKLGGDAPETVAGGASSEAEDWEAFSDLLGELGMGGPEKAEDVEL